MPILTDWDRAVIEGALDLFYRMYEDEWANNHMEDCVRAALTYVLLEVKGAN